jgi:hypothetical protein
MLKPGLIIHSVYNGCWYWRRPSFVDLAHDLRTVTREIRPDWDLSKPELRAARDASDCSPFHGWNRRSLSRPVVLQLLTPPRLPGPIPIWHGACTVPANTHTPYGTALIWCLRVSITLVGHLYDARVLVGRYPRVTPRRVDSLLEQPPLHRAHGPRARCPGSPGAMERSPQRTREHRRPARGCAATALRNAGKPRRC